MNESRQEALKKRLGQTLFVLSFAFYGSLLLMPFASISTGNRMILSSILLILGEASFWIAAMILGRQFISKYRNMVWRSWLTKLRKIFSY
ncbi:Uncharacterised protein [uncultured archaeon]|nr:Uncharacterised protein [uncultured archaeon]